MPDKILAAISPAYGIATGSGPYRDLLGVVGRGVYDRARDKRERGKEAKAKAAEMDRVAGRVGASSYNTTVQKKMMGGGRTKSIDGCAVKGKTKPPVF